jgi:hypothetical protein
VCLLGAQVFVGGEGGDGLNSVEIKPVSNSIVVSLFDVYTTTYFLSELMLLEEHKEAGSDV